MKILIAANHYPVASGRYMAEAFRRLGHEVRTIGFARGNDIWGIKVDPKYTWNPTHMIENVPPDWPELVIVMDTDMGLWAWVGDGGKYQCPVVIYTVDNHVRDVEFPLFDHYFLAHYHGPAYPVDPNRADHSWLPCASDPMFTPSPIAWEDREYDVACVGVMYDRRLEVVNALKAAGLKVFAATGLLYEEYRAAYWNARISLCVSAAGDVAQRIFETGRMGCAILTDPLLDFGDEETNKALGIYGRMTYTNPAEAVILARDLLGSQMIFNIGVITQQSQEPMGKGAALQLQAACIPHTWDARAQVIADWFEQRKDSGVTQSSGVTAQEAAENVAKVSKYVNEPIGKVTDAGNLELHLTTPKRYPFLNLGCGRTHLPGERPAHHALVPADIYTDREWVNVDCVANVGADCVFDLFAYPWPLESDSYDGALLSHLCEHIPHEIEVADIQWMDMGINEIRVDHLAQYFKVKRELQQKYQDGWFAFWANLYRVLRDGAEVHILSPHARSDGSDSDPTHTRHLLPQSFEHSMVPNPEAPFEYATGGIHFEKVASLSGLFAEYTHLLPVTSEPEEVQQAKLKQLDHLATTQFNIVPEFYVRLKVVK